MLGSRLRGPTAGTVAGLIDGWNGNAWVRESSPALPSLSFLEGVACADAQECWAVGYYYAGTQYFNPEDADSIIERWDGSSWTMVSAPTGTELSGVTCASAASCWAVGNTDPTASGGLTQPLIEHWDGASWSAVSSPSEPDDALDTVTCVTATDCWAGGSSGNIYDPSDPGGLIEGWNGAVWKPYVALEFRSDRQHCVRFVYGMLDREPARDDRDRGCGTLERHVMDLHS